MELYEQIEHLKNHHQEIEPEKAFFILQKTSGQAKTQRQEAKEYALKALGLPLSLKHLESHSTKPDLNNSSCKEQ
ncbi:hypothetical protein CU098_011449 [Rhizopus stolonifer]|uniref:Uncharacterized protein n=1 Tax=Rhizopus stolonifer TaxID=4846 RepID=A0A367KV74_RHIST|nr:hypothetical protein CU098_011449 [Rhizopus stolonifer]